MSKTVIYSGFLRTWEQVKANHWENLLKDEDTVLAYVIDNQVFGRKQLEDFSPILTLNVAPETHILNALNQWRNRQKAFSIVEKNDGVYVISRLDIKFSGKIDFSKVEAGKIYIPTGNDYREGVNDQFAFGNYEEVKQYCGLYDNYKIFFNEGLQFHPETYLKRQLRGLEIVRIPQTNQICR